MSRDHLGLFDTPPSRKQIRLSIAVICVLLAALTVTLTVRDVRLGPINAFIPMIDAVTSLVDLIIATLLYVQASVFRSRGLTALASGYVFTALILIPHALTFPGAFAANGLLGAGISTTAWLYMFWRAALPIAVTFYAIFDRFDLLRRSPKLNKPRRRSPWEFFRQSHWQQGRHCWRQKGRIYCRSFISIVPQRITPSYSRSARC